MNQSQFVHQIMQHLFGWDYEWLDDKDCSYELAFEMIEKAFSEQTKARNCGINGQPGVVHIHTPEDL